jgi:hypothetical protein
MSPFIEGQEQKGYSYISKAFQPMPVEQLTVAQKLAD